jgi:hypothetical protein
MAKEQKQQAPSVPKTEEHDKVVIFSIPADDPFIDGVIRHYQRSSKKQLADLTARPFVIRGDDPVAEECLRSYLQRAAGGCDKARAAAAVEALKKLGVDVTVKAKKA